MIRIAPAALAALLACAALARADHSHAHDAQGHAHANDAPVAAVYPFAYASAAGAKAGGAFISLENRGPADRLVAARADIAARTELHEHIHDNGVMKMREVEGGLPLPEGGVVEMKPGGLHVMLMGLKAPLTEGETLPVTLVFESGLELAVEVPVVARGAAPAKAHSHD